MPLATLVPHIYPVVETGQPFFAVGLRTPRTPLGRGVWRAGQRALDVGLEHGRRDLNGQRERLGLSPLDRFHGGISPELALVATYPQLEYPRRWPASVQVTGPMAFEVPHPDVELPPGDAPLVLVAPSTAHDSENHLVRTALAALADGAGARRRDDQPGASAGADRGAGERGPGRLAELQPADADRGAGDLPRRPRHRGAGARRRRAGPDLADHRRHGRDRDAGRLGRRRPSLPLAPLPARAAALGGPPRPRRPELRREVASDRRLGATHDGADRGAELVEGLAAKAGVAAATPQGVSSAGDWGWRGAPRAARWRRRGRRPGSRSRPSVS